VVEGEQRHEATFDVSHALFQLTDLNVIPEPGQEFRGLVVPMIPGGATVLCGIQSGPIHVRAEAHGAAPPPDTSAWQEVAETVFDAPTGQVRVVPLFEDPVPGLPVLTAGPGRYRIRVHARGRDDITRGRVVRSSSEEYLLQVWPEPAAS
jgi:hypothetical protein